ncbi:MAG: methyltransferase domain-containing protein [Alphaproteobacteria bacterium]|jgi:SAM-dependent methyltransferase|nr:methyltransferase domain-containing protein [Alphaproteobacteria bacterium]MDP6565538.1 methyltransferase domain-containing protein [Alphaproteobacteria bacterium]MDP6812077.1 methyltransferase domain-containing protein [Alphaproteobacteria bacterium]
MARPPRIFDRTAVRRHRDRAAAAAAAHDFLIREVADRLADRLPDVRRRFPLALDLGCHGGQLARVLDGRGGIGHLVQAELSGAMLAAAAGSRVHCDEEAPPFADDRFDLVLSVLSLHWLNDLPGVLARIRRMLKPDGLFLGAMLGAGSLDELRQALLAAEIDASGGASPRVSPFVDLRDAGGLMQAAGFALPVVDTDRIVLSYADPFALMRELRGLGEANALADRAKVFTRRALIAAAAGLYHQRHADADGRVPASFQVIYLTGWAPDAGQPKPLRPGSAQARLGDVLGDDG